MGELLAHEVLVQQIGKDDKESNGRLAAWQSAPAAGSKAAKPAATDASKPALPKPGLPAKRLAALLAALERQMPAAGGDARNSIACRRGDGPGCAAAPQMAGTSAAAVPAAAAAEAVEAEGEPSAIIDHKPSAQAAPVQLHSATTEPPPLADAMKGDDATDPPKLYEPVAQLASAGQLLQADAVDLPAPERAETSLQQQQQQQHQKPPQQQLHPGPNAAATLDKYQAFMNLSESQIAGRLAKAGLTVEQFYHVAATHLAHELCRLPCRALRRQQVLEGWAVCELHPLHKGPPNDRLAIVVDAAPARHSKGLPGQGTAAEKQAAGGGGNATARPASRSKSVSTGTRAATQPVRPLSAANVPRTAVNLKKRVLTAEAAAAAAKQGPSGLAIPNSVAAKHCSPVASPSGAQLMPPLVRQRLSRQSQSLHRQVLHRSQPTPFTISVRKRKSNIAPSTTKHAGSSSRGQSTSSVQHSKARIEACVQQRLRSEMKRQRFAYIEPGQAAAEPAALQRQKGIKALLRKQVGAGGTR